MPSTAKPMVTQDAVIRLWFQRQLLSDSRGSLPCTPGGIKKLLRATGGLQLDTINVIDRVTLPSKFAQLG